MDAAQERPPRVLFATPELAPWARVGGLGEVARDLPRALAAAGADVRVLVPAYRALKEAFPHAVAIADLPAPGGALAPARVLRAEAGGIALLLVECDACYDRPGDPYQSPQGEDWPDNALRFGLLSRVAALAARRPGFDGWQPDIVHAQDWPCGLAPAWLAHDAQARAASVMTVHNLAYQGLFPTAALEGLDLPAPARASEAIGLWERASFLKAGLRWATRLTTVSPGYAREIQQAELGFGLEDLLRGRSAALTGILNGIDPETWNPAQDPQLAARYDAATLERKADNSAALRAETGLAARPDAPLFGMVARLVEQKGADLVAAAASRLVAVGAQLVVLGRGSRELEDAFRTLASRHAGAVAARIGFDEGLAHRIEAGADLFLMPSRFEPCGLNQLYSMRYGTPPIVRRTGGLADSVRDARFEDGTGFVFEAPTADALCDAARRALEARGDPAHWRRLQTNGMRRDSSWAAAARSYLGVYAQARADRAAAR